ncbi:Oidioi.mRNA.OKI2018_I69.chr1.g2954.t1.cds [Oikopleura dioica]|uniref:Protein RFT1 homolog n=1 Tax=Oikopleura dioica TaxID=34765 RepID=A0ABN7SY44_OIKDI|nr:Oidioi.mRNA.OKI2018_I69.chr1.g2954.t1.cds [Oikopleura dioica]
MFEEPVYFLSSKELRPKPKTISEASMLVFRAFAYVLAAILRTNILSFAFAHVLSSALCAFIHYYLWIGDPDLPRELKSPKDLLPSKCVRSNSYFDKKQMSRMGSFYIQGVFKNILTQAERYVVTFFDVMSLSQQGLWDTVTSIGALFPRFVFKPLEEGFHLHFCKNKTEADKDLPVILKLSIIIGLFAVAIGIPQAWSILFVYGGEQVSGEYDPSGSFFLRFLALQDFNNPAFILQLCLVNTMACAMNGILEAYMFAVMTTEELNQHNSTLLIFSVLFILGTVTLGKMYLASGLLYAQILNMLLRILHCCRFAAIRNNSSSWLSILYKNMVTKPLLKFISENKLLSSSEIISLHSFLGPESGSNPDSGIPNPDNDQEFIDAVKLLKAEKAERILQEAENRLNRTLEILEDDQMREEMRNISFQEMIINRQLIEKPAPSSAEPKRMHSAKVIRRVASDATGLPSRARNRSFRR